MMLGFKLNACFVEEHLKSILHLLPTFPVPILVFLLRMPMIVNLLNA